MDKRDWINKDLQKQIEDMRLQDAMRSYRAQFDSAAPAEIQNLLESAYLSAMRGSASVARPSERPRPMSFLERHGLNGYDLAFWFVCGCLVPGIVIWVVLLVVEAIRLTK